MRLLSPVHLKSEGGDVSSNPSPAELLNGQKCSGGGANPAWKQLHPRPLAILL